MGNVKLQKTTTAGNDVSAYVAQWEIDESNGEVAKTVTINAVKVITPTPAVGNALRVWEGYTTSTDLLVFDGTVSNVQQQGSQLVITGQDKMAQLINSSTDKNYDAVKDIEAGNLGEIARDMIEAYAFLYCGPYTIASDTIALWAMQETTSVYEYVSALPFASTTALTLVQGHIGNAISFNGTTSQVQYGAQSTLNLTNFTVEAWVNLTSSVQAGTIMANTKSGGGANSGFVFGNDGSGHVTLTVANASTTATTTGATALTAGTWYHVAGTYDGTTIKVYVNGVQDASQALAGPVTYSGTDFRFGSASGSTFFKGKIDDSRVSNTVHTTFSYTDSLVATSQVYPYQQMINKNTSIWNVLQSIAAALIYQVYYWPPEGRVYFEPVGNQMNSLLLFFGKGGNVINQPNYTQDTSQLFNAVTVEGYSTENYITDSFTGDGSTVTFALTSQPNSLQVTVGGTLKNNQGWSSSGAVLGDYAVNAATNSIVFATAPANSAAIVANYFTTVAQPVEQVNPSSIAAYGEKDNTVTFTDLKSMQDAITRGQNLLQIYSTPFIQVDDQAGGGVQVAPSPSNSFRAGQLISFKDNYQNITDQLVITRLIRHWPCAYEELYLGDQQWREEQWAGNIEQKVKQLQEADQSTTSVSSKLLNLGKKVRFRPKSLLITSWNPGNSFIWDSPNANNDEWDNNVAWDLDQSNSATTVVNVTYF